MAFSRLSVLLRKISSFETLEIEEIITEQKLRETTDKKPLGTWSDVKFYELSNVRFAIKRIEPPEIFVQPAEIVVSTYKPAEAHGTPERPLTPLTLRNYVNSIKMRKMITAESFSILSKKDVPLRFNMSYLAYGSDSSKITFRGKQDLFDFFMTDYEHNQAYFTRENVKRLVGQIILAVYDLHLRDCAHRDIKHENFIVYKVDGKIFLVLGDHSDLVETHSNGQAKQYLYTFCGTNEFNAPELTACTASSIYDYPTYQTLDLKANDCYALGVTIYQLLEKVFLQKIDSHEVSAAERQAFEDDSELRSILQLCQDMKKVQAERPTIADVMNNTYFGADSSARDNFFNDLIEERENYNLIIDDEFEVASELYKAEDYFLLLDHRLKSLFTNASEFMESLDQCNAYLQDVTVDMEIEQASTQVTIAQGTILSDELSSLITNSFFPKIKDQISEMKDIIQEELKAIDFAHLSKVAKDILNRFIQANKVAHPHKLFSAKLADEVYNFNRLCQEFQKASVLEQQSQLFLNRLIEFIDPNSLTDSGTLKYALNTTLQSSFKLPYQQACQFLVDKKIKENCQEEKTLVA